MQEAPSPEVLELRETLRRLMRLIYHRANTNTAVMEMPIVQLRCLNAIAVRNGQKLVEIAARTGLGPPYVSRTVDKLVRIGLVVREPAAQDRRAVHLRLTEKARSLLSEIEATRIRHLQLATRNIDTESLRCILASLRLLAEASEGALGEIPSDPVEPDRPLVLESG